MVKFHLFGNEIYNHIDSRLETNSAALQGYKLNLCRIILSCRCAVHLPHLPPREPSRSLTGDGERQLLSAPLEADRLHAASTPQRRPVRKLHGPDPLSLRLLRLLRGIQHHFLRYEHPLLFTTSDDEKRARLVRCSSQYRSC